MSIEQSSDKMGFVRKVYGILASQLLVTAAFCWLTMTSSSFLNFQKQNPALMVLMLVGTIVISLMLFCIRSLARTVPTNYILLGSFTLMEAYVVGFICSAYDPKIVF